MDGICRKRISLILFCSCKLALVSHTIYFLVSCIFYIGSQILHTRYILCNILPIECNQSHFASIYLVNCGLSFKTRFCEYYWEKTSLWLNFWLSDPAALPCPPRGFPQQCKLRYTIVTLLVTLLVSSSLPQYNTALSTVLSPTMHCIYFALCSNACHICFHSCAIYIFSAL